MERERMEYDVVVVGAGPAGFAAAIRLKQLAAETATRDLGLRHREGLRGRRAYPLGRGVRAARARRAASAIGARRRAAGHAGGRGPLPVARPRREALKLPTPPQMHNHGNYIISLGNLCRWLGRQAEALGRRDLSRLRRGRSAVRRGGPGRGVATGAVGIGKDGEPTANFQPGVELRAKETLFAEGCRGSLTKMIDGALRPARGGRARRPTASASRSCGRSIRPSIGRAWSSTPSAGRSMRKTYGGSFLYHLENNQVAVGFVVGLDYENPYPQPFEEFQRFKTHPAIRPIFEGGRRIAYGARALNEGGFQAIPRLDFPRRAGDRLRRRLPQRAQDQGQPHRDEVRHGGGGDRVPAARRRPRRRLSRARSRRSLDLGRAHARAQHPAGVPLGPVGGPRLCRRSTPICCAAARPGPSATRPITSHLKKAGECRPIAYPKPDGEVSFDRLSSVFISNTNHEENQPPHLRLEDPGARDRRQLALYDAPEQRYCPAGVYEIVKDRGRDAAPADQRAELRPLQDLRHQGSDPEHRLGRARRRRRPQLSEHVRGIVYRLAARRSEQAMVRRER